MASSEVQISAIRLSLRNKLMSYSPLVQQTQFKTCGHLCSPSSTSKCCHCADLRPVLQGNLYRSYVDGKGYSNTGSRVEGYCPVCKIGEYSQNMRMKMLATQNSYNTSWREQIVAALQEVTVLTLNSLRMSDQSLPWNLDDPRKSRLSLSSW
jgi:hypothetical protein